MKTIYIVFLVLFSSSFSFAQWSRINGPQGGDVHCVKRIKDEIWAATPNGIYISTNEGLSWKKSTLINTYCSDIVTFNDTIVILYEKRIEEGNSDEISMYSITSFNNGNTWTDPSFLITCGEMNLTKISKIGSLLLLRLNTWPYFKRASLDYGKTWNFPRNPYSDATLSNWMYSDINLIVTDGKNILAYANDYQTNESGYFVTHDGTNSWIPVKEDYSYSDILDDGRLIVDSVILFLLDGNNTTTDNIIVRTSDYGNNWDTVFSTPPNCSVWEFKKCNGNIYIDTYQHFSNGESNEYWELKTYISSDRGLTWILSDFPKECNTKNKLNLENGDYLFVNDNKEVCRYIFEQDTSITSNAGIDAQIFYNIFSNNNTLYASTQRNIYASSNINLYISNDAGQTWEQSSFPSSDIETMVFRGDTIIALSETSWDVLANISYDNGLTWDTILHPEYYNWNYNIEIFNGMLFWSNYDSSYYSNDFGKTWNALNIPYVPDTFNTWTHWYESDFSQSANFIVFENELYVLNDDGVLFKYDPNETKWTFLQSLLGISCNIYKLDSILFFDLGYDYSKYTCDNGKTWKKPNYNGLPIDETWNDPITPHDLVSINGLWVGTNDQYGFYVSSDKGDNWQSIQNGEPPFYSEGGVVAINNIVFSGSSCNGIWRRNGDFENISGIVYNDLNNNGIKDANEKGLPNVIIKTKLSTCVTTTDSLGNYVIITDVRGDSLFAIPPFSFSKSNPSSYLINGTEQNKNFGIYFKPNIADLSIDITNVGVFRPGFKTQLNITITNNGTLAQSPHVELVIDDKLQFETISKNSPIVVQNKLTWDTGILNFMESVNVFATVKTNLDAFPEEITTLNASVSPQNNDIYLSDNFVEKVHIIVGSYDPNDKSCNQGTYFSPEKLINGEELEFTIRFQNTGNYQADSINISDTLSSLLDIGSFRVISSSHKMNWKISNNGVVNFIFDKIYLPYSSFDETNSHGYVKYAIKCKEKTTIGSAITNTANIFFDYNQPIITNTTTTLVQNPIILNVPLIENKKITNSDFVIYPNPTSDNIYIKTDEIINKIEVYTIQGCLLLKSDKNEINIAALTKGIYIIKAIGSGFTKVEKIIKE